MRLIHTKELYIKTWNFNTPEYVILSHRWAKDDQDEVSYQDFISNSKRDTPGYRKILRMCEISAAAGHDWAWIDTACIDKTSSAELSESINSMFAYYQKAAFCCVFLTSVDFQLLSASDEELRGAGAVTSTPTWTSSTGFEHFDYAFQPSLDDSWFGRGWTLQELLAPSDIRFFGFDDGYHHQTRFIGTKADLITRLAMLTGIKDHYLSGKKDIAEATVAERMSWASRRNTSRLEDVAYSLLGIFDVNMPLLYGEGNKAFKRLQEAILLQEHDDSLFAWTSNGDETERGIFATSPAEFAKYRCLQRPGGPVERPPCRLSSKGVELYVAIDSFLKLASPMFTGDAFLAQLTKPWANPQRELVVPLYCRCRCKNFETDRANMVGIVLQKKGISGDYTKSSMDNQGTWIRSKPHQLVECRISAKMHFLTAFCGYLPIFCHSWGPRRRRYPRWLVEHFTTGDCIMNVAILVTYNRINIVERICSVDFTTDASSWRSVVKIIGLLGLLYMLSRRSLSCVVLVAVTVSLTLDENLPQDPTNLVPIVLWLFYLLSQLASMCLGRSISIIEGPLYWLQLTACLLERITPGNAYLPWRKSAVIDKHALFIIEIISAILEWIGVKFMEKIFRRIFRPSTMPVPGLLPGPYDRGQKRMRRKKRK